MVVAGAGSGKTRVITCRIVSLIHNRNIPPENILAITFTNKAAGEMKERVHRMLGHHESSPWIGTFHSFCLQILRKHISAISFTNDFAIYDGQDQLSLVKQSMKAASVDEKAFTPKAILHHISGFKNDFLLPEDMDLDSMAYGTRLKAAQVYPLYQAGLRKNNALDFDDLLVLTVRLFRESEPVLERYNNRYRYILVDEFQDTNEVQYQFVRLLSRNHRNVCVVGDDDQSIYRWRGANLKNILNFEIDFPGTTVIKLEENYRSTQNILKAASGVVKENVNRKAKTLWTRNEDGAPIIYYRAEDERDEARAVCDRILKLNTEDGILFSDMAVLYRTNAQSRVIEDALRDMGVPYQLIGGLRFYERKEIKDVLAFMRVVLNPSDSVSLKRIINVPPRGIGKTSIEKVENYCRENDISLLEGLRVVKEKKLTAPAAAKRIAEFYALLDRLESYYREGSAVDFLTEIVDKTGYGRMLEKEDSRESRGRLENLQELFSAVDQAGEEGKTLKEFLDTVALVSDTDSLDDERGVLPLMTLHTCKGLEFHVVFIIGMEDGLLPHSSSMSSNEEYEEERRLCYVGFTRAKKRLFVSNARRRRIYGNTMNYQPSDFLFFVPPEIMVREDSPDLVKADSVARHGKHMHEMSFPELERNLSNDSYSVGTKVLHSKFGTGVVINKEGDLEDLKVEIFFQKPHGKKKLAVNKARLIIL